MRTFDYSSKWKKLLTPEIVSLLTQIHEIKGEQSRYIEVNADALTQLVEISKIQSAESSNRIVGISISNARLRAIVKDKTTPKTRDERVIAGYRDVLNTINENHDYINLRPNMILQLHRDMYKYEGYDFGGKYKTTNNKEEETDSFVIGNKFFHFCCVPALETPEAIYNLCDEVSKAMKTEIIDPLLLIPMFVIDFLCVHPFNVGNGRMSRLLTLLLLYRSGYIVGKYISIEHLIEKTQFLYFESLQESSNNWVNDANDYIPFVQYMLGIVLEAYRDFSAKEQNLTNNGLSKSERVAKLIHDSYGEVTKSQIMGKCPDISKITIERTLADLVASRRIKKIGGGRYTKYIWNRDLKKETDYGR